jgi:threonine/homoserine/homoserine lactone efflux protein
LAQGRGAALPLSTGVALGTLANRIIITPQIGAIADGSQTGLLVMQWMRAALLCYLGLKLWRARAGSHEEPRGEAMGPTRLLAYAGLVAALNPLGINFFLAIEPQFLDRTLPLAPQVAVLAVVSALTAFPIALGYGLLASGGRALIRSSSGMQLVNRVGAASLIGVAVTFTILRSV